jgi:exosortase/archaeosortase family protein
MKDLELETEKHQKLYETTIFLLKLIALGIIFRAIIFLSPSTYPLQAGLAQITSILLQTLGLEFELQGALMIGEKASYLITQDCLGWKSIAAFTGLLIASTENIRKTTKPLAIGITALIAINIFRIVTTVYLSHQGFISFDIIHTFFWKWGLTGFVFLFWLIYMHKAE